MSRVSSFHSLVYPTSLTVLQGDLGALPDTVAHEAAVFVVRRIATLSLHMRIGIFLIAAFVRLVGLSTGRSSLMWLSHRPLPLIGEYFRLIRSLSFTYIWEKWPDTCADGRHL